MNFARRMTAPLVTLAFFSALSGCSTESTGGKANGEVDEEDLRGALQAYFDAHLQCTPFFDLPAEVRDEPSSYRFQQLETFASAGLLRRVADVMKPHEITGVPERFARFEATPAAQQSFKSGTDTVFGSKTIICYGRRKVGAVQHDAVDEMRPDELGVKYEYTLADVPAWTALQSIRTRYPGLSERVSNAVRSDSEVLKRVDGKWVLEKQTALDAFDFRQLSH